MMLQKKSHFKQFNEQYFSFITFIKSHINNKKFDSFYFKNKIMRQTNIKYFIKSWNTFITIPHYNDISTQNAQYFLTMDYSLDKLNTSSEYKDSFEVVIDSLKQMYSTLDIVIVNEFMEYIKILTQLSYLYFNINN